MWIHRNSPGIYCRNNTPIFITMDSAEFDKYRGILKRAFFGDNSVLLKPSYDDFWTFFKKYQAVVSRKGLQLDKNAASSSRYAVNSLGLPQHYNKQQRQSVEFNIGRTERHMLRDVPQYIVQEFEYILFCYFNFLQRERMTKIKKLRQSQQALPMFANKEKILSAIAENPIVVIAGDTGCGKSTQLPQYLLEAGYDNIACTQPRRIACISLAKRVAFETLNEYGSKIAYQIRFEKTKTLRTKMVFLTEGLLLRQLGGDPTLSAYNVIILDEVHERHLHADFLLGILKEMVEKQRTDLKLVLMSATINIELFSNYFGGKAPVVCVPGRLYPIKLHCRPLTDTELKADRIDPAPYLRLLHMIDEKYPANERGDMLVFLSGINEITRIADALQPYAEETKRWIILMLHSTLSIEEQDKVFDIAPEGVRKCILATNIAETSVTIDGVRFVVDSGKVKEMKYDSGTRMHRLQEIWVSKASAEQRKGRAGRTGPGICYRLYSTEQFDKFDDYTTSEIHRVSLESLVLQMYSLGLPNPREFPFIEAPSKDIVESTIDSLKYQGPISANEQLTSLGKILVNLPIDVAIGKMLIMGCLFRQVEAVLTMASALSVQSPFTSKSFRDRDMLSLRTNLVSDHGDAFAFLNVYREWLEVKQSGENTRRWAQKRGIEEQRLYEITKLRNQFKDILEQSELIEKHAMDLTGTDRRIRYGELKRLKELKRTLQTQQRKRKVLKLNAFEAAAADDEGAGTSYDKSLGDVNAVDFQMKHTTEDLESRVAGTELNYATVYLTKVILANGLYPQYGILDEHNTYRDGSDVFVHTMQKPFVVLHPNGCLGSDADVLRIDTADKRGHSALHQLLFYAMLLETAKPYLVNTVRLPALHTLLLFARSIDTNRDCSRLVCDGWLRFDVDDAAMAQLLLFEATAIREMFAKCLQRKLEGDAYHSDALAHQLLTYLQMEVVYGMKRLLKADQNMMYVGTGSNLSLPLAMMEKFKDAKVNEFKGGLLLTEFLTYGCLFEEGDSALSAEHYLTINWVCPVCEQRLFLSPPERMDHLNVCGKPVETGIKPEKPVFVDGESSKSSRSSNPLKKSYYCQECEEEYAFTATEILKHKRSHRTE